MSNMASNEQIVTVITANMNMMSKLSAAVADSTNTIAAVVRADSVPLVRRKVRKNPGFWEEVVPTLTDKQFKDHFRVNRSTFNTILSYVKEHMQTLDTNFKQAVAVDKKVAIALTVSR